MKDFLTWVWELLRDQRGAVGDDLPDDDPDKDKKVDQDKDEEEEEEEEEDLDELFLDLDEEEEKKEAKKKADKDKVKKDKETEEDVKKLRSENEALKGKEKEWKRREYQTRKDKEAKGLETDKDAKPLTDAQLTKLLETAESEGDTHVKLNVLKYLAEQVSEGKVKKAVNAAEMGRKAGELKAKLEERFPDIADPTSDMRVDIDRTKEELGIVDHPYGDMFAVGFRLFEDMDELLEASYEAGKETLKDTVDKKRKKEIKDKSLPISRKSRKEIEGLKPSYVETANQMDLTPGQLKYYKKLAGKKPRTVSVEG